MPIPFVSTDHHLKMADHHLKEYNKAKRNGQHILAKDHAERYYEHKEALENLSDVGNHHKS